MWGPSHTPFGGMRWLVDSYSHCGADIAPRHDHTPTPEAAVAVHDEPIEAGVFGTEPDGAGAIQAIGGGSQPTAREPEPWRSARSSAVPR
eukprot:scaffold3065_cov141-Isochrysis_galbana.AAC.4